MSYIDEHYSIILNQIHEYIKLHLPNETILTPNFSDSLYVIEFVDTYLCTVQVRVKCIPHNTIQNAWTIKAFVDMYVDEDVDHATIAKYASCCFVAETFTSKFNKQFGNIALDLPIINAPL